MSRKTKYGLPAQFLSSSGSHHVTTPLTISKKPKIDANDDLREKDDDDDDDKIKYGGVTKRQRPLEVGCRNDENKREIVNKRKTILFRFGGNETRCEFDVDVAADGGK